MPLSRRRGEKTMQRNGIRVPQGGGRVRQCMTLAAPLSSGCRRRLELCREAAIVLLQRAQRRATAGLLRFLGLLPAGRAMPGRKRARGLPFGCHFRQHPGTDAFPFRKGRKDPPSHLPTHLLASRTHLPPLPLSSWASSWPHCPESPRIPRRRPPLAATSAPRTRTRCRLGWPW